MKLVEVMHQYDHVEAKDLLGPMVCFPHLVDVVEGYFEYEHA
jgi:hypothetical protein